MATSADQNNGSNCVSSIFSSSANELIEIVNEKNEVQAPQLRGFMRANRLIHRATYAFIRNSDNYYYVQKRSSLKDYCPSFFDPTPGGVVAAGESYEDTNRREIEEEMGIPPCTPMEHLLTFFFEDHRVRVFGDIWDVIYDGPLVLQAEEVDEVHLMSMQEILDRSQVFLSSFVLIDCSIWPVFIAWVYSSILYNAFLRLVNCLHPIP